MTSLALLNGKQVVERRSKFISDSSETFCVQTLIQKRRANGDWLVEEMVEVVEVVVVDDRVVLIRY